MGLYHPSIVCCHVVLCIKAPAQDSGHFDESVQFFQQQHINVTLEMSYTQYAEWDLKKTSSTLTETLIGLFLMA